MADITFHNVGHGEYISIDMQTNNDSCPLTIIRDFGAYSACKQGFLKEEAKSIIASGNKKDAILSHAHKDHYDGFVYMHEALSKDDSTIPCKPFRNVYLPYLRFQDVRDLGSLILKVGVYYLYALPAHSDKSEKIKNWIKLTPIMFDLSEDCRFVDQGDTFDDWSQQGTVLWPPKPDHKYSTDLSAYLSTLANKLGEEISNAQQNVKQNQQGNQENPISFINDTYEKLRNALHSLVSLNQTTPFPNALELINEILTPYLEFCRTHEITISSELRNTKCKEYLDTIDNHSLVFSLADAEGNNGVLFLSDLDGKTMDIMLPFMEDQTRFKIIKSAHHGSRIGDLFENTVQADTVIHCCGCGNRNQYGPAKKYLTIANTNICSDWVYNNAKWENRNRFQLFNNDIYTITI